MLTGLTVGLLSISAVTVVAVQAGSASGETQVRTISASRSAGGSPQAGTGSRGDAGHGGHHHGQEALPAADYDAVGGATPAPQVSASAPPLEVLANNCDNSKLPLHDGFQAGNRCVTTEFGEVGENAKNPTLIISSAPRRVRAGQPFQIKVSTRNLVRDRFLAAAQGGYYK